MVFFSKTPIIKTRLLACQYPADWFRLSSLLKRIVFLLLAAWLRVETIFDRRSSCRLGRALKLLLRRVKEEKTFFCRMVKTRLKLIVRMATIYYWLMLAII